MGAAEPVIMGEKGRWCLPQSQFSTKSAICNPCKFLVESLIAEAMVDKDIILVLRDHKIIQLEAMDQAITSGPHPDTIISGPEKLLTLRKELIELGVSDFIVKRSSADALGKESVPSE